MGAIKRGQMWVRMLETRRVTADGVSIRELRQGGVYWLRDFLARRLVAAGQAVAVDRQKQE